MVIGKGSASEKHFEGNDNAAAGGNSEQQEVALAKWHQQLNGTLSGPSNRNIASEAADNPVRKVADVPQQIGDNGMPVSNDPIANMVSNRVAQHMHNYAKDGNPLRAADTTAPHIAPRPSATSADIANGLWGPESAANAAQYNGLRQDFNILDGQFTQELLQQNITGTAATQMRQFLYFCADKNQRQQYLTAYNLTEPKALATFQQKYGAQAFFAIHWAVEDQAHH